MLSTKSFGEDARSKNSTDELLKCSPYKPFKFMQIYNVNFCTLCTSEIKQFKSKYKKQKLLKEYQDHIYFNFQTFSKHTTNKYLFAVKTL